MKKIKGSSGLVKSLQSETDDGLSSCSNFPERPTLEEKEMDKPVLPEIEHLRGTEVLFRSHDQMGHQGINKVQQRILHRFDWPGL